MPVFCSFKFGCSIRARGQVPEVQTVALLAHADWGLFGSFRIGQSV